MWKIYRKRLYNRSSYLQYLSFDKRSEIIKRNFTKKGGINYVWKIIWKE